MQDVEDLIERQVLVDRHDNLIEAHRGQVCQAPLDPVLTDDGDVAALFEAEGTESHPEFGDVLEERVERQAGNRIVLEIFKGNLVAVRPCRVKDHVLDGCDLRDGEEDGFSFHRCMIP